MGVILTVEQKTWKARVFLALIYLMLSIGGVTMLLPFLIMVASSLTGPYDYYRFSPVVRALWSRQDRFVRSVAMCYPRFPSTVYPDAPQHWGSWVAVARDVEGAHQFAQEQLDAMDNPQTATQWRQMAADYADFNLEYDVRNSVCSFDARDVAHFVRHHFEAKFKQQDPARYKSLSPMQRQEEALALLNREWAIRYVSFFGIRMVAQQRAPMHHPEWDYPMDDPKTELYQDFKRAYRELAFVPGCQEKRKQLADWSTFKAFAAKESPMTRTVPFESRIQWINYLKRPAVMVQLGLPTDHPLLPEDYARLSKAACERFESMPFPLPADAPSLLQAVWANFIHEVYPRRLLRVRVTPPLEEQFQAYVRHTCRSVASYAQLTGKTIAAFTEVKLLPYENSALWRNFIPLVPLEKLEVLSAEQSWQAYLLSKYGSLEGVNSVYGWRLTRIEEARFPLREAMAVTFAQRGWRDFIDGMTANYRMVAEYLFLRGQAFGNTILLVLLSIVATLTVNPLAAYALSRLGLRFAEKLLLFMLATMAFPAAVTAIPGFLLIRDLGLLNTFAALVLPTLASGMSIFILKGFFDGLPRELYEAAMIDGAKEWQVFLKITLPMTTPILAVNALNAFVAAYNSWEWALLVCQKQSNWTLAVWMYQMSQQMSDQPWAVMAGFVMVSIPTAIVFFACQKIILRGIVLPSMK